MRYKINMAQLRLPSLRLIEVSRGHILVGTFRTMGAVKISHQTRYVAIFSVVLSAFFLVCFRKHSTLEAQRNEMQQSSLTREFPIEAYSAFKPFIEQVLIPAYGSEFNRPLKRKLRPSVCTQSLFNIYEIAQTLVDSTDYSEISDSVLSKLETELSTLHVNRCTNVLIQSMTAGLPKLFVALLMLAPFNAEYFESIRFGFKWNPEFRDDNLLRLLASLRLSIVSPSLLSFGKYLHGHFTSEVDYNFLSLPPIEQLSEKTLVSLVDPEQSRSHATINLDPPRSIVDFRYDFAKVLREAVKSSGPVADSYSLRIDWYPQRYPLPLTSSMKLHGEDGEWYHLTGAFLMIKHQLAYAVYDKKLRIWTLFKADGTVQSIPAQFVARLVTLLGTEMYYSK